MNSSKLNAYVAETKGIPKKVKEGKVSTNDVLDIGDIVIKVSYTAENGPIDFKNQVRSLREQ